MTSGADPTTRPSAAAEAAPALRRRDILRRGALFAGAATGAVVALKPHAASADDGDNVVLGQANTATVATTVTVGGDVGGVEPALALENADGPSLRMQALPHTWAGQLAVGEMAGTELGPIVGVETAFGPTTTYLVTGVDLANMATPFAGTPTRVLDLRTESGRAAIIRRSSADALTPGGRLRGGQWIDIAVAFTGPDFSLDAVFANLTGVGSIGAGSAVLYAPGVRPPTRNLSFAKEQTVSNAAFVGAGTVMQHHAVRLYTTAMSWFVLDVTGGLMRGVAQAPLAQAQVTRAASGRVALVDKVRKALGRIGS